MTNSDFGIWAMLIFWGSAIGGILLGISWAKRKGGNPVGREQLLKSLEQRLERGEITQEEYEKRVKELGS
jgi:putative membrane protein